LVSHTYTVVETRQRAQYDGFNASGVRQHQVSLDLDSQPGGPVRHWGSLPQRITLADSDAALLPALGDKVRLTLSWGEDK